MRRLRRASLFVHILAWAAGGVAVASFNGPPAITVFPDDYPVDVSFFFPAGGPLERFTSRPGAWYAVYRMPMVPGRPYDLILEHEGDPGRMKIFALDHHPFEKVSVKFELPLRKIDDLFDSPGPAYASTIALPRDASLYGIYLLLEWNPPLGQDGPVPVSLQVLSADLSPQSGYGRTLGAPWAEKGARSPLQGRTRNPYEIPVPRSDLRNR